MTMIQLSTRQFVLSSVLLLLLSVLQTFALEWTICSEPCSCKWVNGKKEAFCENQNLVDVPALNEEIQNLLLDNNQIKVLRNDIFSRQKMINLQWLSLRNNGIEIIEKNAFGDLVLLTMIDLSFNKITELDPNSFRKTNRLRVLRLYSNKLQKIEDELFRNLTFLETIELSNNEISYISPTAFSGLQQLTILQLKGNRLSQIESSIFNDLVRLQVLGMANNPWNCDCHMRDFVTWLTRRNLLVTNPAKCSQPALLQNVSWENIRNDLFACKPKIVSLESQFDEDNGRLYLSCEVLGDPRPETHVMHNARILDNTTMLQPNGEPKYTSYRELTGNGTQLNVTLNKIDHKDYGVYICSARNEAGLAETNVTFHEKFRGHNLGKGDDDVDANSNAGSTTNTPLEKPYFVKPGSMRPNQMKPADSDLQLKCQAAGNPMPNITWLKNSGPVQRLLGDVKIKKYTLGMRDLTTDDNGNYTCVVCNVLGCINFTYTVRLLERMFHKPLLTKEPENITLEIGASTNIHCDFLSDATTLIKWFRNSNACNNSAEFSQGQNMNELSANPKTLSIENVTYESEGWYTCVAGNNLGFTCASAYLKVVDKTYTRTTYFVKMVTPASMIPVTANFAPLLFRTLTRAGFARELGQIQRATNIYAMSFNLLMIVFQAVYENQKKKKAKSNVVVDELRHVRDVMSDQDGQNSGSKYLDVEKAFNKIAEKLEHFYSCEAELVDGVLQPTKIGLQTCEKRCSGVPLKITHKMINSLAKFPKSFGNGKIFIARKKKDKKELEKFRCVENESNARFVCQCPRAPIFQLTDDMKNKLREFKKGRSSPKDFAFVLVVAIVILGLSKSILLGLLLLFTASVWGPYLTDSATAKHQQLQNHSQSA